MSRAALDLLAPMPRRLIDAVTAKGYAVHVSTKRETGRVPVLMVAISGKPRQTLGSALPELERLLEEPAP